MVFFNIHGFYYVYGFSSNTKIIKKKEVLEIS